jgi:cell division septation protein DedD
MRAFTALFAAVCLCAPAVFAQSAGGKRPGLLEEIRSRLSFRSASEVWEEARLTPSVDQARTMMESLLERRGDPVYAARAALWLGHFEYGAQQTERALVYFETGVAKAPSGPERDEALFWASQCRALLDRDDHGGAGAGGMFGVLQAVARIDGELRAGRAEEALRGYLSLEGDARRAGCLGPLLYRVGLAGAAGADERGPGGVRDVIARWERDAPVSPERALAAAITPEPVAPPPLSSPAGADSAAGAGVAAPVESGSDSTAPTSAPSKAAADAPDPAAPENGPHPSDIGADRPEETGADAAPIYAVQLGAFADPERARSRLAQLTAQGLPVRLEREERDGETLYKIRLGEARSREEAQEMALRFCRGLEYRIVRVEP